MPNGGTDAEEQIGAFIFPTKFAPKMDKIIKQRDNFMKILNS
jgi:hypothetical protein